MVVWPERTVTWADPGQNPSRVPLIVTVAEGTGGTVVAVVVVVVVGAGSSNGTCDRRYRPSAPVATGTHTVGTSEQVLAVTDTPALGSRVSSSSTRPVTAPNTTLGGTVATKETGTLRVPPHEALAVVMVWVVYPDLVTRTVSGPGTLFRPNSTAGTE